MKLGTHNSLSYLKPQWWLRLFNLYKLGKCQEVGIAHQYELGARWFDLRIRFTKKGIAAAHGMLTFKDVNMDSILDYLDSRKDTYVRFVLETKMFRKPKPQEDELFKQVVLNWVSKYKNIHFINAVRKRPWEELLYFDYVPVKECYEHFEGKDLKFPLPKYYAKKNNSKYWSEVNDEAYSLFDYINIK